MQRCVRKGYANLSVCDVLKIERLYPQLSVLFKNKIERLRAMINVDEQGLLCGMSDAVLLSVMCFGEQVAVFVHDVRVLPAIKIRFRFNR